jgi:cytochrome c biogenesis protein CcmG/thiol:disulfide interchange protein DsbE
MRPATLLPLAAFAALAAVLAAYLWQLGPGGKSVTEIPSAMIDKEAPPFSLPPLAGVSLPGLASEALKGQVSLVNFFASWCLPCRAEHPILMRLAQEGVTIYGISYKDKPEDSRAWLADLGTPYKRIGVDGDGRTAIEFGVYGVPETYVIDREGRIRYRQVGPIMPFQLDETIRPLMKRLAK